MARFTPEEIAEKQITATTGATERMRSGIEKVTVAPGRAAASQQAKLLNNFQAAVTSGKWARNVSAVTLEEWQRRAIDVGIPNVQAGMQNSRETLINFHMQLAEHQDRLGRDIRAMPNVTLDQRLGRMVAYARGMTTFSHRKR